jgi:hypothetical protein
MNVNLKVAFHFSDKTKPVVHLSRINSKNTFIYANGMQFELILENINTGKP